MFNMSFTRDNSYESIPDDDNPETVSFTDKRGKVEYNVEDHIGVILQKYGSIWPKVLGWCIANTLIILFVMYLHKADYIPVDLSFSDKGHGIMSLMVSYLVVTRCSLAYTRWTEASKLLSDLMRCSRELVQHMVVFTKYESGDMATKWRVEVAHGANILLRMIAAVIEYDCEQVSAYQVEELTFMEKKAVLHSIGGEIERAPNVLALFLRSSIASHNDYLTKPLDVNEELQLHDCTTGMMTAYYGLAKLMNTPFPFPLVQMARTFLFVWVVTLPFSLDYDIEAVVPVMLITFFLSYGFLGLEFVSIELDDPFGKDDNDFDVTGLAKAVIGDICLSIQDIDGSDAANSLRTILEPEKDTSTKYLSSKAIKRSHIMSAVQDSEHGLDLYDSDVRVAFNVKTGSVRALFGTWEDGKKRERLS